MKTIILNFLKLLVSCIQKSKSKKIKLENRKAKNLIKVFKFIIFLCVLKKFSPFTKSEVLDYFLQHKMNIPMNEVVVPQMPTTSSNPKNDNKSHIKVSIFIYL